MSKLPEKLIVVGMRHVSGAQAVLSDLSRKPYKDLQVILRPTPNEKATGSIAYEVILDRRMVGYIREADLPILKNALGVYKDKYNGGWQFSTTDEYELVQICANYLVLKLRKDTISNPCNEIFEKPEASQITPKKEENMFDKLVANNKSVAVNAAYMEAGRIANNQVTKLVAAKAPLMVKGYVDTPVGKVVLANLTAMAVEQFRPTDLKLKKVSVAMMTQAYQELIQTVDIEGMLNELASSDGIKTALAAVAVNEEAASKA